MLVPKTRTSSASKKKEMENFFKKKIQTYLGKYPQNYRYQSYDRYDIYSRPVNPIAKQIKVSNLQTYIGRYVFLNDSSLALFHPR